MGFVTCGPNEAMVVSGFCYGRPVMIPGGRVFVWPVIQQLQKISLNTMTLQIKSENVNTKRGVPLSTLGVAQVKIQGKQKEMLASACMQFLGKSQQEIKKVALETLEGHQRAIIGNMTVEEIYMDRKKFSNEVFAVASSDLLTMGITVVSYTLKDITDKNGYLKSLGMTRIAQIHRDAKIGEAQAKRDAGIREALAKEAQYKVTYHNKAMVEQAKRDYELKKAIYDQEVSSKKAESDLATTLQTAITSQAIKEEEMQIKVQERAKQIELQDQEILRKERELEATVKKPAEAEKFRLEKIAEAERNSVILEAEATAEAIRVRGAAEAFAIEAKASADAEQMAKKADAWKQYHEAAMVDMVLAILPKVVAEIAAPLTQANKITLVSSGKDSVGASKITGEIMDVVSKLPQMVENLTGVNIGKTLTVK